MSVAVGVREFRARLSELLDKAEKGETVVVTRRGKQIAQVSPPPPDKKLRRGGWMKGKIWIAPDIDEAWEEVLDIIDKKQIG